ncbi:MAG: threonylcarbamoyl-AMP synthase [Synergistales bacterium]|nr:threonylcarbamoyl-AMP synthase [Synergistales bacterium]
MTRTIRVDPLLPETERLAPAAETLRRGGLVAFPTETVYGLGADALDAGAVRAIFAAKGRPVDNPLIVHLADYSEAHRIARVDARAEGLFRRFAPGPLTLVLPASPDVPGEVTAGLGTVGVRIPAHPVAFALLSAAGCPVAAPSANSSGRPSPTCAADVLEDLDHRVDIVVDGGSTSLGLESTVIDATGERLVLLRPGGLPVEEIEELSGPVDAGGSGDRHRSPGTRYRHYAPRIPLLLWDGTEEESRRLADRFERGEALAYMGIAPPPFPCAEEIRFATPEQYAASFFQALRRLERSGVTRIVAQWPGEEGIGRALRDRLSRAAGGR